MITKQKYDNKSKNKYKNSSYNSSEISPGIEEYKFNAY